MQAEATAIARAFILAATDAAGGNTIVGALCLAVTGMAGFIVWLFRFVIATQNERIQKLEGETASGVNNNTKAVTENTETLKEVLNTVRALSGILIEQTPRNPFAAPPGSKTGGD